MTAIGTQKACVHTSYNQLFMLAATSLSSDNAIKNLMEYFDKQNTKIFPSLVKKRVFGSI